jgi:hypothetical protein
MPLTYLQIVKFYFDGDKNLYQKRLKVLLVVGTCLRHASAVKLD